MSAPALIFFGFTVTFASFDWLMSLDPHWYSSISGVYFFAGTIVSYFAVQGLLKAPRQLTAEHRHGLGKLLFGFVCFWAYIAFSQYLLISYANLPEETIWYRHRFDGTWLGLSAFLAVGHFVLPFFYLLPQGMKKNKNLRAAGSAWLLLMHYLDLYWVVMPNFHTDGIYSLDAATLAGATALLSGAYLLLSKRTEEIPISDPRLAESLGFDNA